MKISALRAALRIARRDATRARGRSILIVVMIGLPVLGLSTADVLARTAELSPTEKADRELGASDAHVLWGGFNGPAQQAPSLQDGWGTAPGVSGDAGALVEAPPPAESTLRDALPPGATVVARRSVRAGIRTRAGVKATDLVTFDYSAPTVRGLTRQVSGRSPRTATEVALTRQLAHAVDARVGDTIVVTRPQEKTLRVVGIVDNPYELKAEAAFTVGDSSAGATEWYVKTPRPITWSRVLALNAEGFVATSREVALNPPPRSQIPYFADQDMYPTDDQTVQYVTAGVLIAGMALLEVVLLAGPAFAVGARRRRRELALVAATGGERADVRNIVLAGGVVAGVVAGVVGVAAGIALAAAVLPGLQRLTGSVAGHFEVRPLELAAIALVSVVTGLIAAFLPARAAARQDVVATLAGRRGTVRTRARISVIGLLVALAGAALAVGGAAMMRNINAVLAGAVIAEIGLIICTPTLLGLAGRLGRRLPLSPRLALRDAARNRSAATPAVAAVMAAVAGSVGIGIVVASMDARDRAAYQPTAQYGDAFVTMPPNKIDVVPQVEAAMRKTLPNAQIARIRTDADCGAGSNLCRGFRIDLPPERACPAFTADPTISQAEYDRLLADPRCANREPVIGAFGSILVDDGSGLPALTGTPAHEGVAALRAGKAVVFDSRLIKNGTIIFTEADSTGSETQRLLPAVAIRVPFSIAQAVVPDAMARQLGLHPETGAVYAHNRSLPTEAQEQALQGAIDALGIDAGLTIERGYVNQYSIGLLALVIGAAVITLGAATIATSLANVDSRPDLATLAAIGASPRVRRSLSMSRAGVIAVIGTALGVLAGFLPSVGFILTQRAVNSDGVVWPLVIPWPSLSLTAIVVPLLAVAIAGLFSRSRLPIERRAAT